MSAPAVTRPPFLACLLLLLPAALAQQPDPWDDAQLPESARVLTLEECITRALERNFSILIQSIAPQLTEEGVVIADSRYDPALGFTASNSFSQDPNPASELDGAARPTSEAINSRANVTKRVITGGSVTLSTALNRRETNSRFSLLNPAWTPDVELRVSQPILQGGGIGVNRVPLLQSRIDLATSRLEYLSVVMDIVRQVESAYYQLVFSSEQLEVRRLSLRLAEQLLEENRIRRQTGIATDLDVLSSEVQVATQRRNLLQAQQQLRDRRDVLLALIGQFELDSEFRTDGLQPFMEPLPHIETSYQLAKQNQPEVQSALAQIERLELDVRAAKNQRLPTLNLEGVVGFTARNRELIDSLENLPAGDGYDWNLNLVLQMPWGLRAENARYRQALLRLGRESIRFQQLSQNILVDVREAVRAVETSLEAVQITALATQLSERQYELQKARFDAGLSTIRDVLLAQEDLDSARVEELQAMVGLRTAYSALQRVEGTSLERYNIEVDLAVE